ncbi:hypothetical protein V502_05155 [Pseudogymnoascus sp. VKM F-4520 (FW-2644)]|nr:hypothetical protein V502_05155 [Pseudogymnoascus sp. VKM F-4520 (FW-2644)]
MVDTTVATDPNHVDEKSIIEDGVKLEENYLDAVQGIGDASPTEIRRVLWKIDLFLLPVLAVCYMLQYLDKSTLNYSTLLGLTADLNLVGSNFSWSAGIFYFGYLFWSPVSAYLIVRFPIGKYLTFTVLLWACVVMCHAACKDFKTLMVTRFFLGVTEASVAPGFSVLTSMFYTRNEQPLRHGIWFLGNGCASILGGVVSWAIGSISVDMARWKVMFLIFGGITLFWGIVMAIFIPDGPSSPLWLNAKERQIAIARTLQNKTGTLKSGKVHYKQVREALIDPQVWCLCLYIFSANLANGGLSAFGSLVVAGFGFKGLQALLLQMPTGAAQIVFVIVSCITASKVKSARVITMITLTVISTIGMVLMFTLDDDHKNTKLAGFCFSMAFVANQPLAQSLIASNIAGFTKKATVGMMMFMGYCLGNIIGPQFFYSYEAPIYRTGIKCSLIGFCMGVFFLCLLGAWYLYENRRRDRVYRDVVELPEEIERQLQGDLTDIEIKSFRYLY